MTDLFAPPALGIQRHQRLLRVLAGCALVALALTPLVMDPGAKDDAYFAPKWAWIAIWSALGVGAVLARVLAGRAAMFRFNAVWIATVGFTLWHWVAVLWAQSPSLAIERATQMSWLALAIWVAMQWMVRRGLLVRGAWIWIAVATTTALWVLLEDALAAWFPQYVWIRPNLADWRGFLGAGLGNTNHLGDFLVLGFLPALILMGEARGRRTRGLLVAAATLVPAALIVCFSAGSNLGLMAGAGLMLALVLWRDRGRWFLHRWGRWAVMCLLWAGTVLFFTTDHPLNPHRPGILRQGFGSERWQAGGSTRLAIWAESLEMIRQRPIAGVGTGNFTYIYPRMDSKLLWGHPELRGYQGMWTNAAHNELLQTWAELGVAGLFGWMALIGLAYFSLLKGLDEAHRSEFLIRTTLAGMLTAWVAHAQMNFALQHSAGALSFYAILFAVIVERETRRGDAPPMPPLRLEMGCLALRVDWRDMRKPTAVGMALILPAGVARGMGVVILILVAIWAPIRWRPVLAQRAYSQADDAEKTAQYFQYATGQLVVNPALLNDPQLRGQIDEKIADVFRTLPNNQAEEFYRGAIEALGDGGPDRLDRAGRAFKRAVDLLDAEAALKAEENFRRALELDPQATGCRSRFSAWLVEQGRYEEALTELMEVRKRLDSNELWEREARALAGLGRHEESARAMETYRHRLWRAREHKSKIYQEGL